MNSKREKPKKSKGMTPEELLNEYRLSFPVMAQAIVNCTTELSRVRGILSGTGDAESLQNVQHRIRSLVGHREALGRVVDTVQLLLSTLERLATTFG